MNILTNPGSTSRDGTSSKGEAAAKRSGYRRSATASSHRARIISCDAATSASTSRKRVSDFIRFFVNEILEATINKHSPVPLGAFDETQANDVSYDAENTRLEGGSPGRQLGQS